MLTNQILSYYNQLLAASIMYLTVVDPLKDLASNLSGHTERDSGRLWTVVVAEPSQDQDYYKTLGVGKDATKQEIHRAFRQLAKKYHPDKNKDKSATEEFIKIFKAYETLSDEKKRKEYDQQKDSAHSHSSSWSSTTSNMNDFDINDFFKQYEDQFMRHAQHHQHHDDHSNQQHYAQHQQHHQDHFNFHGINLDELFSNIDDEEFSSFGKWFDSSNHNHNHLHHAMDGHFGDGASYFGTHFPSPMHDTVNQYHQMYNHYNDHQASHSYSCQTITRQVNGMTMTQTSCS